MFEFSLGFILLSANKVILTQSFILKWQVKKKKALHYNMNMMGWEHLHLLTLQSSFIRFSWFVEYM